MRRGVNFLLVVGAVIVLTILGMTLAAPLVAPFSPEDAVGARLQAPGGKHPMGTDQLRRDVLSRVIYGGRTPLMVAGLATVTSLLIGTLLGWLAGMQGGTLDRFVSLLMDALYSFPALILAIIIVAMLGPGIFNMVLAIVFVYVPTYFRVARGQTLQVREQEHVEGAIALGASQMRILLLHVAPLTVPAVLALTSFTVADAILTEAALSFLGFGLPPPVADWGFDIQNGQKYLQAGYWWLITFPGMMIILLSFGFGLVGEGVNEALNPRRRRLRRSGSMTKAAAEALLEAGSSDPAASTAQSGATQDGI